MEISIMACDLEELPEGEHYVRDLIGCRVVDIAQGAAGEGGAEIGVLADVIQNTAQSILDVRTPDGKSVLIPAVDAFLRSIDEEAGLIEVELIPGFLD
jgi:16S rRNA processing protein RimM